MTKKIMPAGPVEALSTTVQSAVRVNCQMHGQKFSEL